MREYRTKYLNFNTEDKREESCENGQQMIGDEARKENYIEEKRARERMEKPRKSQGFRDSAKRGGDKKNREERMKHGREIPERVRREATESGTLSEEVQERIGSIRELLRRTR